MSTQVIYNGVDITKDIEITNCVLVDSNGGKQDYCKISFANGGKMWNEWQPQKNDKVQVINGHSNSGTMFVNGIESDNKTYVLMLLPTPTTAKKKKSRIWRNVKLSEIITDVSNGIGFKAVFFGFKDYTYKTLSQKNQTDISFLCDICKREGYNVKVYGEKFIIYNEKTLYATETEETIKPDDCLFYGFSEGVQPLSAVTVRYYDVFTKKTISYTAKAEDVKGGSETLTIKVDNQAQAERFSENILASNNNKVDCGTIKLKKADVLASGSVINLSGFKNYDGKWYINESVFYTVNDDCVFSINRIRG